MEKYHFRLTPVLKLRKLKEETCRMELGRLLTELQKIEDQVELDKHDIDSYFKIQDDALKRCVKGGQVQAFPMLVSAKDQNIKLLIREKMKQEKKIEEKKQELAILRGELKVMEKLQEKSQQDYRKAFNKDMDQKVEEQTQNWLRHMEKKGKI